MVGERNLWILHVDFTIVPPDYPATPHVGTAELQERSLWITGVLAAGIDFLV